MTEGGGFDIQCLRDDGVAFVVLSGELDLAAAPDLHSVLLEEIGSGSRTVVDLDGVSFLDSSGLSVLVTALRRARDKDSEFALCSPSPFAARALELAGLDGVFEVFSSRTAAATHANGSGEPKTE
jgi:anti-sigma B factor antagonist